MQKMNNFEKIINLPATEMPKEWYNILADLPRGLEPPMHPETKEPLTPDMLSNLFPDALIEQEMTSQRFIPIPEEVLNIYSLWRPTPLVRATNLEKYLDTPAKIYFKNESVSPPGSHKPNTAVAQSYYNYKEGVKKITTETGAGQWGSSLSFANKFFGMETLIYMVKVSFEQKPYRKVMMNTYGGIVYASPSNTTKTGREILKKMPDTPGSLGMAISEAVEVAMENEDTKYSLGSVLNHVLLHQTVIGSEAKKQMEKVDDYPDIVIGCVGGGSNFGGISLPFISDILNEKKKGTKFLAVEPDVCPTLTEGKYEYDFGDSVGFTPLLKMYTLGHDFVPPVSHSGGLRYHGMSPIISKLYDDKLIEAVAYNEKTVFEAAVIFARTEGIIPAPESSHAIKAAMDVALKCKETGEEKTILFNLSGHGYFDMSAYQSFLSK